MMTSGKRTQTTSAVLAVLVAATLAACSAEGPQAASEVPRVDLAAPAATTESTPESVPESGSGSLDIEALADAGAHARQWNSAAGPFLHGYLDESVDGDAWVTDAVDQLDEMSEALDGFSDVASQIEDPDMGIWMASLGLNYHAKFEACIALVEGVRSGSSEDQQAAWDDLEAAASNARALYAQFPEVASDAMTPEEVAEYEAVLEQLAGSDGA